jgi:hypothetical protein
MTSEECCEDIGRGGGMSGVIESVVGKQNRL